MLWILRLHTMHTTIFEGYSLLYRFNLAYDSAIHEYRYHQNSVQFSNIDIVQVVHSLNCSQLTLKLSEVILWGASEHTSLLMPKYQSLISKCLPFRISARMTGL